MFEMNIRAMRVIMAFVQEGNMTKAAEKIYMTQPAITRTIQKVEEQIGLKLFCKEKNPWSLTYVGQLYMNFAKQMLAINDNLVIQTESIANYKKGLIKIGVMLFEERYIIPKIMTVFQEKYPDLLIEIITVAQSEMEDILYKNIVDFSLLLSTDNKEIECIPVKRYDILLALPLNHFLAQGYVYPTDNKTFPEIDLRLLSHEPFVMMKKTNVLRESVIELCEKYGFEPNIIFDVENMDAAMAATEAGCGVSFFLDEAIYSNGKIKNNSLAYFKIKGENLYQEISFAYIKSKRLNKLEENFLETIKEISI